MASIKVKFRPSTIADKEGIIFYQILHDRKPRQLISGHHIFPHEWDSRRATVATTHDSARKYYILSIREGIRRDTERLTKIIGKLEASGITYTAQEVINEFNRYVKEASLFNNMEAMIMKLKENGKIRTSETYRAALNSFSKFRDGEDIMLDVLNSDIMEAYEAWLSNRGIAPNTISFYLRILRASYNRAIDNGVIENRHPFRRVYTGIDKTVKRALPLNVIKKIKSLDLSFDKKMDYARDMFMISFMLRGMSFIDMAYLRKSDLNKGYIVYRRRKTGQQLTIKWTKEMQLILDKYPENASGYLLPIIRNPNTNERFVYKNMGDKINRNLKNMAQLLHLNIPLTLYVARHSWASIAKVKGIPLSVISEGMGHDSELTTQIYLASLDTAAVDKANSIILDAL